MNIAVVFAGGVGKRMGETEKPKQFLEVAGKPIIIHTLEIFENHEEIDAVIVACLEDWIDYLEGLIQEYGLSKVSKIVPGGASGQMSIFSGVAAAHELYPGDSTVLIHDGVRPFISAELISENIRSVKEHGSAISCVSTTETFLITDRKKILEIPERDNSLVAKAPQSFILDDIYKTHLLAQEDGITEAIDSCTLMYHYGKELAVVMTDYDNIKITTPKDLSLAESIYERRNKDAKI